MIRGKLYREGEFELGWHKYFMFGHTTFEVPTEAVILKSGYVRCRQARSYATDLYLSGDEIWSAESLREVSVLKPLSWH